MLFLGFESISNWICVIWQVQFCVGTPPGIAGRRRSTSGSSCGTSPPPYGTPWPQLMSSPHHNRRGGANVAGVAAPTGPLAPIKGSPVRMSVLPNVSEMATTPSSGGMVQWRNVGGSGAAMEWNALAGHPHHPTRTMTLPEFTGEWWPCHWFHIFDVLIQPNFLFVSFALGHDVWNDS